MAVVGIGVIGLVHDVETGAQVGLQHPLLGPGQMAPVVGMQVLGVGHDRFQITEPDIRISQER